MKALVVREILVAARAGGGAALGLAFFLIVVLITALGLGRDIDLLAKAAPGTLWVGSLLATLLSLDRLFQADFEDGTLEALALVPAPLEAIVTIKVIAHWLTTGLPLVILSPIMALMLQLPTSALGWMILSLTVGTLSLSALGAIGASLTLGIRRGGLLLSLLVAPLFVPTLIFGVQTIKNAADGADPTTPFLFLIGLTFFSIVISPIAASYALRVNMS